MRQGFRPQGTFARQTTTSACTTTAPHVLAGQTVGNNSAGRMPCAEGLTRIVGTLGTSRMKGVFPPRIITVVQHPVPSNLPGEASRLIMLGAFGPLQ